MGLAQKSMISFGTELLSDVDSERHANANDANSKQDTRIIRLDTEPKLI